MKTPKSCQEWQMVYHQQGNRALKNSLKNTEIFPKNTTIWKSGNGFSAEADKRIMKENEELRKHCGKLQKSSGTLFDTINSLNKRLE